MKKDGDGKKKEAAGQKLQDSELRYRRLFEAAQDGILILDAGTGAITDVNPFLIHMLGYTRQECVRKKLWEVGAFQNIKASKDAFLALQKAKYIRYKDLPLRAKSGKLIAVEFVSNVYWAGGKKVIQCNIRDITERKQAHDALLKSEAHLREQSVRDHLTGLFNRRYMEETLERELMRASRRELPLGVIMLDVDDFKQFNDTYGHAAGDAILHRLGGLLLEQVRGEDIPSRYGGDEFIIILPDASRDVLRERAEGLRESARRCNIQVEGRTLAHITFSLGIAVFPQDGTTGAGVLRAADRALYRAKREGRDRVELTNRESNLRGFPEK
ncbi:MAG: GGDEF domain-containing protein [Anaerolineales bacterium]|nr:GGDEF domain-containing protein [Anaerolineales bacterium]